MYDLSAAPTTTPREISDHDLLRAFVERGDQAAFQQVSERHVRMVAGVCERRLPDDFVADDAIQAVFLVLAAKARGLLQDPRPLGPWLHQVAIQVTRNHLRHSRRQARREHPLDEHGAGMISGPDDTTELADHLDEALAALPRHYRDAVVLHYLQGHDRPATGNLLGLGDEALKKRLSRGLAMLRERLQRAGIATTTATLTAFLLSESSRVPAAEVMSLVHAGTSSVSSYATSLAGETLSTVSGHAMSWAGKSLITLTLGTTLGAGAWLWADPARDGDTFRPGPPPQEVRLEAVETTPAMTMATQRGLSWLATHQAADGRWSMNDRPSTGVTAMCTLAFLGAGHFRPDAAHHATVVRALDALRGSADANGALLVGTSSENLYDHGLATLCLAEAFTLTADERLLPPLTAAVAVIVRAQSPAGGWRYTAQPLDADVSMTATQLSALLAARSAGIAVPPATITRGLTYVRSCFRDPARGGDGGFAYMPGGTSAFPRSAAATWALIRLDDPLHPAIAPALDYVARHHLSGTADAAEWTWYARYYTAAVLHHAQTRGEAQRHTWQTWFTTTAGLLMAAQQPDGRWLGDAGAFPTAVACLVLLAPKTALPTFRSVAPVTRE